MPAFLTPIEPLTTTTGGPPQILTLPEAASQTYRVGALLALDNAGMVVEATSGLPGAGGSLANVRIVGIAAEPGHAGTAGQFRARFWLACSTTIFVGHCDGVTSNLDVGRAFLLEKDATGVWKIDKSVAPGGDNAANRMVIIYELDPRDPVGDNQGRMRFIFSPQACALTYTS